MFDRTSNVPVPATDLIGRDELVAEVAELMRTRPLVTLTGVGGVGKTRVAIEVGGLLAGAFPDGAWLVELAAVTAPSAVAAAISSTLGVTSRDGTLLVDALVESLATRRMLLILDNCEHLADAAASVVEALQLGAPGVRVLATSREPLGVRGEHRRLVLPLSVEGGAESPAVAFFMECSRRVHARLDVAEPVTASAIVEICRGLDGLPLGIELAAARTVSMTPIDLRDRLGERFGLLTSTERVPHRQQTLHNTVAWSFQLLDDRERALLRHASVFVGGFDLAAITGVLVAGPELDVLALVDSLVRKSLVTVDQHGGTTRYGMLETIRQFAELDLRNDGSLDEVRDRMSAWMSAEATARWERWNGPAWRESVDWLAAELANLRVAFRWARDREAIDVAVGIAAHAGLMGASVQLFETVGWAEAMLDDAERAGVAMLPRLCTAAAWGCFTGAGQRAVDAAVRAQELEDASIGDPVEPGLSGLIEALAQVYCGRLDQYVTAAERVVARGGRALGWGLPLLVDGLQASGHVDEAVGLSADAQAAAIALGNPYFIAYSYWTAGSAFQHVEPARSLELWREGLDYVRSQRVDFFVGFIARDAARLRLVDASPDDALTMFDAAIEAFDKAGNVVQLVITLASAIALFERLGRFATAASLCGALARYPGAEQHVPELPAVFAGLVERLGDHETRHLTSAGSAMDLGDTADLARRAIAEELVVVRAAAGTARPGGLSAREVEVLRLAAEGLSTKDIAERLYISAKTADRHLQNLYTKIGVSNRASATRWASQQGLMD